MTYLLLNQFDTINIFIFCHSDTIILAYIYFMREILQFAASLDRYLPGISIDCVLLGYKEDQLHVLLLKWKNVEAWSLPGGFLKKEETLEMSVGRVLQERTGIEDIFLKQFHTFSNLTRDWQKDDFNIVAYNQVFGELPEEHKTKLSQWFSQRFVSTGFIALVDLRLVKPVPDFLSDKCEWVPLKSLPPLILDHDSIIEKALSQLKKEINYLPIGQTLLPEKFTMKALRNLYEAILDRPLERSNFQRKILSLKILIRQEKLMTGAANKAPYLYSFDQEQYQKLLKEGMGYSFF